MELEISSIKLDLSVPWKLSRNESLFKNNFIVTIKDAGFKASSEVAPNIRYGETPEIIIQEFEEFTKLAGSFEEKLEARPWKHSLRFALESAFLHLEAQKKGVTLASFLNLKGPFETETCFSVPIMEMADVEAYVKKLTRFKSLKIKVNKDCALALVQEVHRCAPEALLRVDGNEAWDSLEDYLKFEKAVATLPIEFIEQPFAASRKDLYRALFPQTKFCIMADESIEDVDNLDELKTMFHAVNVKLMKTGSLIKGRDLLLRARALGLKTMGGCMIETGLGISYALYLSELLDWADLDGFLLIKNNPFPLIEEREGVVRFI
jgi:L-alanine-DL-glutamate epimerase-like enolase superfamily enzyme